MMHRERDYDDVLRRALLAAADSIEPSSDGLERIRARLTPPMPLAAAWLMAGYSDVAVPAMERLWFALTGLRVWQRLDAAGRSARGSLMRHSGPPGEVLGRIVRASRSRRYAWLRPVAVATAVVVAVAGGFALSQLQRTFDPTGAEAQYRISPSSTHSRGGSTDGRAVAVPGRQSSSSPGSPAPAAASPSPSASCSAGAQHTSSHSTPAPKPSPSSSPSPSPSSSPSASPTPSQTTPSSTPTSTPSSTTSGSTEGPATLLAVISTKPTSTPLRPPCGHPAQSPGQQMSPGQQVSSARTAAQRAAKHRS